jgi:cysteine-rich repeat protein
MTVRLVRDRRVAASAIRNLAAAMVGAAGCVGLPPAPPADAHGESNSATSGSISSSNTVDITESLTDTEDTPDPICGNGISETAEICDDGNGMSGDGCSADCLEAHCLVPITHTTVQGGIDDLDCPTVWVSEGTYYEVLTINRDVSLLETDNGDVIVDAGGRGRPLTVSAGPVVIGHLRLTGGEAEDGGGIHNTADLLLDRTEVSGNRAVGIATARGGGVFNAGGTLVLVDARIVANTAEPTPGLEPAMAAGGGIFSDGGNVQLLASSEISANQAVAVGLNPRAEGGGIYAMGTQVSSMGGNRIGDNLARAELTAAVRDEAEARARGGGAYLDGSSLSMNGGLIEANHAQAMTQGNGEDSFSFSEGGGVVLWGASATLDGTVIRDNSANADSAVVDYPTSTAYGGGLSAAHGSTVTMTNAALVGNQANANLMMEAVRNPGSASARGGGLHGKVGTSTDTVTFDLVDCVVDGNRAMATSIDRDSTSAAGGAAYISSSTGESVITLRLERSLVVGNAVEGSTARAGGIYATSGTGEAQTWLVAVNSTFSGNEALSTDPAGTSVSGALYIYGGISTSYTHAWFFNTTITENVAGQAGGLYLGGNQHDARLVHSIVQGNSATLNPDLNCVGGLLGYTSHNLVGATGGCNLTGIGDLNGQDALLFPLADNGGPTATHAIDTTSLAHDGGNPVGCSNDADGLLVVDQRGEPRPAEAACDIGAFEHQP